MLNKSNCKAFAVLSILHDIYNDTFNKFIVEPYLNGREQGFAVYNWTENNKVTFSENRNSDNIVVYFGTSTDFSMQGNTPSENTYRESKFFDYNDYVGAADFIKGFLGEYRSTK